VPIAVQYQILSGIRENFPRRGHLSTVTELDRSHAELLAAVLLAGKEIRKLNFGRADSPVLAKLRAVLREARAVAGIRGRTKRGILVVIRPTTPPMRDQSGARI